MAGPREVFLLIPAAVAVISLAVSYHLFKKAGTVLFLYGLLLAAAVTVSAAALTLAPGESMAQAIVDLGITLAGAMAFAASGWLKFVCGAAGDPGDR